jgi:hypothetical protein
MTIASAAGAALILHADPDTTTTIASEFLAAWDKAWNHHDAHALGELHTSDAATVNRFGTLLVGRAPTEKALGFLHSKEGPFGHSQFPALKLLEARRIMPSVMIVHAGWKNPVMHPDGKISDAEWNDMIVTFVLVDEGQVWRASEVDAHNVEKMNLPYSNHGQKS